MESKNRVMLFIMAFVALVVGLALLGVVADMVYENTHRYSISRELVTVAAKTATLSNTDAVSATYFGNGTNTTVSSPTNFILGSTINISTSGVINVGGKVGDGAYNVSYSYDPPNYISNSASRSIVPLIVIFFAMAILLGVIYYFRDSLRIDL